MLAGLAAQLAPAKAEDTKGCEGLGEYRTEMFAVGSTFAKTLKDLKFTQNDDLFTKSSDDWQALADASLQFQRDLKEITPPDWIRDWHDLLVTRAGALQNMALAAVTGGVLATTAFTDTFSKIDGDIDDAKEAIAEGCGDAAQFFHDWDALDGSIDGTPVATPTF
jgi:hypothetical protein